MTKRLISAALGAALFAANPITSASDGIMKASTPVCPTQEAVKAIWEVMLAGRFAQAVELASEHGCFLAKGVEPYFDGEYLSKDVASALIGRVKVFASGELHVGWYTMAGGMRCAVDCPPGAIGYHD